MICNRCVLNSNFVDVKFDNYGICNYCRTYDKLKVKLNDFSTNRKLLEDRFNSIKGKYDYDCLVGLSGGKDSSFVTYQLKEKYGLKILAVTFDNGFLTDYAKENIRRTVKKLNIEHMFLKLDPKLLQEYFRQSILRFGYPCIACTSIGFAFINKLAFERNIPFCIHGYSRGQMFHVLLKASCDPFLLPFVVNNLSPYNIQKNKKVVKRTLAKIKSQFKTMIKDKTTRKKFYEILLPDMKKLDSADFYPELLGYFVYEKYDLNNILETIKRELDWSSPENQSSWGHFDCSIHEAVAYLYYQIHGHSLLSSQLSVMVREGDITREEALRKTENENCVNQVPDESLNALCQTYNLKRERINNIISRSRLKYKLFKLLRKCIRYLFLSKKP